MSSPNEEIARNIGIGIGVAAGAVVGVKLVQYFWNKYQNWSSPTSAPPGKLVQEQKKAWENLAGAVKTTEGRIADLNKWGTAEARDYKAELEEIKQKGSEVQKKYQEAKDEFGPFQTKVAQTHTARRRMREHDQAMTEMKPLLDTAAGVPMPNQDGLLKTSVQEFAALKVGVPDTASDVLTAHELAGKRKALEAKARAVINQYDLANTDRPGVTYENWDQQRVLKETARRLMREHNRAMQEMKPLLEIIAGVPVPTADTQLKTLLQEFDVLKGDVPDPATDVATAGGLADKRKKLEAKAQAVTKEYQAAANPTDKTYTNWLEEKALKETEERQIREHNSAMLEMKPLMEIIAGVPVPKDEPLKTLMQEFAALKGDVPDTADVANTGELASKRKDLEAKAREVIKEYKAAGDPTDKSYTDWLKEKVLKEEDKLLLVKTKISVVPDRTEKIVELKKKMADAKLKVDKCYKDNATQTDCVEGEKALEEYFTTAQEIITLRDSVNKDEAKFFKKYQPIRKRIEKAAGVVTVASKPLTGANDDFDKAYKPFEDDRKAGKFKECSAALDNLKEKTDAVLKPGLDAAENTVRTEVLAMPTDSHAEKKKKVDKAAKVIAGLDPVELEAMDPALKMDLLKTLRVAKGYMPVASAPKSTANKEKRGAQMKVYQAMNLDETFMKEEKAKRQKLVDNLAKNELIKNAQKDWKIMTDDQRLEVFQVVTKEQCEAFGFKPPPGGIVPKQGGESEKGHNGGFSSVTNDITLNFRATCIDDFELAVDLIAHENSHNYQNQLIARLDPNYDPEEDRINKDGPHKDLYLQAMMFQCNEDKENMKDGEDPAYVNGGEDPEVYRKQPQEEHAWYAGPKTAHSLVKALNKATTK